MASNKDKLIASAQKLVEKGQLDKGLKEYLRALTEDASDVRLWLKVGDLHVKLAQNAEAAEAYMRVAQHYCDEGFYRKAVAVYKQIVRIEPRLVDVNVKLADLFRQLGLISDAIVHYDQVAAFYQREGRIRESLTALQQIVELEPDNVSRRIKLAEMYSKEKMTAEAVSEFTRAADHLKERGRTEDFMKVAERLLFLAPDNHQLARELAQLYIERGDPRRALPKLQVCFKADARDTATLGLLAAAFEGLSQMAKALSVLRELARIHHENGDEKSREHAYRKILTLAPDDAEAQAVVGGRMGTRSASPAATQAHAPAGGEPEVRRIAAAVGSTGQPGSARTPAPDIATAAAAVQPVAERSPPPRQAPGRTPASAAFLDEAPAEGGGADEEIARLLGEVDVYRKYGLHARAYEHLQRVFQLAPRHGEGREKLASILVLLDRREEAIKELWGLYQETAQEPGAQVRAEGYLREILRVRPGDRRAAGLLAELVGRAPAPVPAQAAARSVSEAPPAYQQDEPPQAAAEEEEVEYLADDALLESDSLSDEPAPAVGFGAYAGNLEGGVTGPGQSPFDAPAERNRQPVPTQRWGPADVSFLDERTQFTSAEDLAEATLPPLEPPPDTGGEEVAIEAASDFASDDEAAASDQLGYDDEAPAVSGPLEERLDQADYYMHQRLYVEARRLLEALLARFPRHPLVVAKLQELGSVAGAPTDFSRTHDERSSRVFRAEDTSQGAPAGFDADLHTSESAFALPPPPQAGAGLVEDEAGGGRRNIVEKGVLPEDFDTHYDLGIAYKEMGILDDAINEFRIVMQDPAREVMCHMMIGLCNIERNRVSDAISQFKSALYAPRIQEQEKLALYYELGQAYERLKDAREALYYYEKVIRRDAQFRDVERRIAVLRGHAPPPSEDMQSDEIDAVFDGLVETGDDGLP